MIEKISGDEWKSVRTEMLEIVAQDKSADNQADIYIYEKMHKESIEVVEQASWFYHIDKVIEAVKVDYPEWAFHPYHVIPAESASRGICPRL